MLDAPEYGSKSSRPCPLCKSTSTGRIVSSPSVDAGLTGKSQYPYICRRFHGLKGVTQTTGEGHPIIESRQHEREVGAKNGLFRD